MTRGVEQRRGGPAVRGDARSQPLDLLARSAERPDERRAVAGRSDRNHAGHGVVSPALAHRSPRCLRCIMHHGAFSCVMAPWPESFRTSFRRAARQAIALGASPEDGTTLDKPARARETVPIMTRAAAP